MNEGSFRQELLRQAKALVFNNGGDAAALAFRGAAGEPEEGQAQLREMDLTALSSIHRMANGSVELKFIDRIKLIELLLSAGDDRRRETESDGFIQALDRAALRLGGAAGAGQRSWAEAGPGSDEYAAGELDLERERGGTDAAGAGYGRGGGSARGGDGAGDGPDEYAAGELDLERERGAANEV